MARSRSRGRGGIRTHLNYTVEEAAQVTGYAKGTILRKIKAGILPAIVDRKPFLILGGDLADLVKPKRKRGAKLKPYECLCFRCRLARSPALGMADYLPLTGTTGNLTAICGDCGSMMNKVISIGSLDAISEFLQVTIRQGQERLIDTAKPCPDDHLDEEPEPNA